MTSLVFGLSWSVLAVAAVAPADRDAKAALRLMPEIETYLAARAAEFEQISPERKSALAELAQFVRDQIAAGKPAKLTFICTHNSRRSQMGQVWAAVAAARHGIPSVETFSGGTEATAFNPRAVAALKRAGLTIESRAMTANPRYEVQFLEEGAGLPCFSKKYDDKANPASEFCAVMTCSDADQACPRVAGAAQRVALTYDDPKASDDTPEEAKAYDERCRQICREMLYVFSNVRE